MEYIGCFFRMPCLVQEHPHPPLYVALLSAMLLGGIKQYSFRCLINVTNSELREIRGGPACSPRIGTRKSESGGSLAASWPIIQQKGCFEEGSSASGRQSFKCIGDVCLKG